MKNIINKLTVISALSAVFSAVGQGGSAQAFEISWENVRNTAKHSGPSEHGGFSVIPENFSIYRVEDSSQRRPNKKYELTQSLNGKIQFDPKNYPQDCFGNAAYFVEFSFKYMDTWSNSGGNGTAYASIPMTHFLRFTPQGTPIQVKIGVEANVGVFDLYLPLTSQRWDTFNPVMFTLYESKDTPRMGSV